MFSNSGVSVAGECVRVERLVLSEAAKYLPPGRLADVMVAYYSAVVSECNMLSSATFGSSGSGGSTGSAVLGQEEPVKSEVSVGSSASSPGARRRARLRARRAASVVHVAAPPSPVSAVTYTAPLIGVSSEHGYCYTAFVKESYKVEVKKVLGREPTFVSLLSSSAGWFIDDFSGLYVSRTGSASFHVASLGMVPLAVCLASVAASCGESSSFGSDSLAFSPPLSRVLVSAVMLAKAPRLSDVCGSGGVATASHVSIPGSADCYATTEERDISAVAIRGRQQAVGRVGRGTTAWYYELGLGRLYMTASEGCLWYECGGGFHSDVSYLWTVKNQYRWLALSVIGGAPKFSALLLAPEFWFVDDLDRYSLVRDRRGWCFTGVVASGSHSSVAESLAEAAADVLQSYSLLRFGSGLSMRFVLAARVAAYAVELASESPRLSETCGSSVVVRRSDLAFRWSERVRFSIGRVTGRDHPGSSVMRDVVMEVRELASSLNHPVGFLSAFSDLGLVLAGFPCQGWFEVPGYSYLRLVESGSWCDAVLALGPAPTLRSVMGLSKSCFDLRAEAVCRVVSSGREVAAFPGRAGEAYAVLAALASGIVSDPGTLSSWLRATWARDSAVDGHLFPGLEFA